MKGVYSIIFLSVLLASLDLMGADAGFDDEWEDDSWGDEQQSAFNVGGFVEFARGRFNNLAYKGDSSKADRASLHEARARVELDRYIDKYFLSFKTDLLNDSDLDETDIEVREAFVSGNVSKYDFRAGRQPLTWGTGDLVFINDLFPKDWQSFFAGREISYLKAPVDAFRVTRYAESINIDLALLGPNQNDRYLTGERFGFFNPAMNAVFLAPPKLNPQEQSESLNNSEVALRLFKNVGNAELAAYAYKGFYKQPVGFDPVLGNNYFPELEAIGFSALKPLLGGIANTEIGFHRSVEDDEGDDPFIKNSELRYLVAYERELIPKLTAAMQYYLEWIQDYDHLIEKSFNAQAEQSERRHTLTLRLRYALLQDKLRLNWFSYYSPDENDSWVLPSVQYQANDQLSFDVGANVFNGKRQSSFLGQFEQNDNFYGRVRYSF
jgi:hypothetical protein